MADQLLFQHKASSASISLSSPLPIMAPRVLATVLQDGSYELTFLNQSKQFQPPFDWHRKDLDVGTRLWKLNLHYHEFLEATSNEAFQEIVADWVQNNAPYKKNYWLDNWNSYALSIRIVVWMQQIAKRKPELSPEFLELTGNSIARQLRFLLRNMETDIRGNHILKNIKALLWGAAFFEGRLSEKCRILGEKWLSKEITEQILSDGFHFERSVSYHAQVFVDLLECNVVTTSQNLRDMLDENLPKMADVLVNMVHDDNDVALFNDAWLNASYTPDDCLEAYRKIFDKYPTKKSVVAFSRAGYFVSRIGGYCLFVDAGKVAPDYLVAHGHADTLSFELSAGPIRLIVDAGVYEYDAGEMRDYSRKTSSHNCVTLGGLDQTRFFGSFRAGRRANILECDWKFSDESSELEASHDGYAYLAGNPVHSRRIALGSNGLLIFDKISGGNGQLVEARFLVHPDLDVVIQQGGVVIRSQAKSWVLTTDGICSLNTAWYCPEFGVRILTKQIVVSAGGAPTSITTTLRELSKVN